MEENDKRSQFTVWFLRKWAEWDAYEGKRTTQQELAGYLGIPRPGLHDIRRAGALELHRNGMTIAEISKYLGHQSLEVTMRYLAITPDDLRNAHRRGSPVDNSNI